MRELGLLQGNKQTDYHAANTGRMMEEDTFVATVCDLCVMLCIDVVSSISIFYLLG